MAREMFGIASLSTLADGMIAVAIDEELKKIGVDLVNRPGLKKARVLTLKIGITPSGNCGDLDHTNPLAKVKFKVVSNVPLRESADYTVKVNGNGSMVINPDSPDNPNQGTLDEVAGTAGGTSKA